MIAFDTETDGVDPRTANLAYLSTYNGEGDVLVHRADTLPKVIMHPLGHNLQYDSIVAERHGVKVMGMHDDTMIKAWEKDMDDLSLKGLATRLLNIPVMEFRDVVPDRKQTIFDVDAELAGKYAAQDAYVTWRVNDALELSSRERFLYEHIDQPLIPILVRCTQRGMDTNVEEANRLYDDYEARCGYALDRIRQVSGVENPNSRLQLLRAFEQLGVALPRRRTAKGEQSLDEEVLKAVNHPLAALTLHYRDLRYQQSHYIVPLQSGHLSFLYKIHGTETGRISTEKPNGQNFPELMRRLFTARKGKVFVIADYSGIEMCISAEASGDTNLRQMFLDGRSPHKELALRLYGEGYTPEQYVRAKSGNFERLYGGGVTKLMEVTGCSKAEAQAVFDMNAAMYPELDVYLETSVMDAYRTGYAETLYGRRRSIPALFHESAEQRSHGERQAKNTPIQGTAGDLTKRAMVMYNNYRDDIIHQQHDEIIVECDEADAPLAAECLKDTMIAAGKEIIKSVPVGVEVYTSKVWSKAK